MGLLVSLQNQGMTGTEILVSADAVRKANQTNCSTSSDSAFADILCACKCLQCFDAVGWVAGRASGL